MPKKGVAAVIGRAAVDGHYRELLKNNPLEAMEGYDLAGEEKQAIAGMDYRHLDKLAGTLNRRLRDWFVGWASRP